jgi:bisphosphoglycerate-independent phosphoglycerate mutase (AlkP superfamily)
LPECVELIQKLNRLFKHLLSLLNKKEDTLLITSDHGNMEDCSIRAHTLNPVPLTVWGQGSEKLRSSINEITEVSPAILHFFNQ